MPDPVATYFQSLMEDIEAYAVDALDADTVIEETRSHGGVPTAALMMLGGPVLEPVFRLIVSRMVSVMTEGQQDAITQAAAATADGTITERERAAYQDQFVAEARPMLDRLNDEAASAIEHAMRDAFPRLISHTAVFMEADGDTFEERVQSLPRDEAEEHINALTGYMDRIREAVKGCDHVTVSVSPPGIPVSVLHVHVRSELLRVLDAVKERVTDHVGETVAEASADTGTPP